MTQRQQRIHLLIQFTDENGATATASITITVNGANDAFTPVARNDTDTVEEDATLTVQM